MTELTNENKLDVISNCLNALPTANPAQAAHLLIRTIDAITVAGFDPNKWLLIARRLQPSLNRIRSTCYQHIWRSEIQHSICTDNFNEVGKLHLKLAEVCMRGLQQTQMLSSAKSFELYIQYANLALSYWYLYALDNALSYQLLSSHDWKALNHLYHAISEKRLADYPVIPTHERSFATLSELYKRCLLLEVINPSQFTQRELLVIDRLLLNFTKYIDIHPGFRQREVFGLQLASGQGLQYADVKLRSTDAYGVDVSALQELLLGWDRYIKQSKMYKINLGDVDLSKECLQRLLRVFVGRVERRYRRIQEQGVVDVRNQLLTAEPKSAKWQVTNTSPDGYCLMRNAGHSVNVAVGELIQLRNSNYQEKMQWSVGVIRWVRQEHNDKWHAGIQLISPTAELVAVAKVSKISENVLYLPQNEKLQQPASIIVAKNRYHQGDEVDLNYKAAVKKVRLLSQLSEGNGFVQFAYQTVK